MHAMIQMIGTDILCCSAATPPELRRDGQESRPALARWAERYDHAVRRQRDDDLLAIGRELFAWLNENGWAAAWTRASGPRALAIRIDELSDPLAQALLDAPWELLARADGHLADDAVQLFEVTRRIGAETAPIAPRHSDLKLMFMAAAPEGVAALDYEAEEAAILDATQGLPLQLVVEESGCAQYLSERLALDGPFEALHLSRHGDIDPEHGPRLALEDPAGDLALADRQPIDLGDEALVKRMPARALVGGDSLSVPPPPRQPPAGRSRRDHGPSWRKKGGQGGGLRYRCRHRPNRSPSIMGFTWRRSDLSWEGQCDNVRTDPGGWEPGGLLITER